MTIKIEHSLQFVTELDESHPISMQILALEKHIQKELLEGMLRELLVPRIQPAIDELNANGSYAILKVAE